MKAWFKYDGPMTRSSPEPEAENTLCHSVSSCSTFRIFRNNERMLPDMSDISAFWNRVRIKRVKDVGRTAARLITRGSEGGYKSSSEKRYAFLWRRYKAITAWTGSSGRSVARPAAEQIKWTGSHLWLNICGLFIVVLCSWWLGELFCLECLDPADRYMELYLLLVQLFLNIEEFKAWIVWIYMTIGVCVISEIPCCNVPWRIVFF